MLHSLGPFQRTTFVDTWKAISPAEKSVPVKPPSLTWQHSLEAAGLSLLFPWHHDTHFKIPFSLSNFLLSWNVRGFFINDLTWFVSSYGQLPTLLLRHSWGKHNVGVRRKSNQQSKCFLQCWQLWAPPQNLPQTYVQCNRVNRGLYICSSTPSRVQ